MQTNFNESQTKINLMRAFAAECQAQNRYNIAARAFSTQNYEGISRMFRFTAEQEEQHAKVFFDLLQDAAGELITINADYPADSFVQLQDLIDSAARGEEREFSSVYPDFARIAADEGFPDIQAKFEMIAEVEDSHRRRFSYYSELLKNGTLFRSDDTEQIWVCLNCGHLHKGSEPPLECPVCTVKQGWFVREQETAFTYCGMLK